VGNDHHDYDPSVRRSTVLLLMVCVIGVVAIGFAIEQYDFW
jgi:hypothetical protein